ncbi:MAG: DUF262 domain-containing protein [Candidatus Kapabacteria bacterium]|nr:DUF262 domain-containing protein [Candidatus Kapabacteria bacterium]
MKTSGTNIRLRKILSGLKAGSLIPRPDFQRRLVWANKHKVAFIQTVLDELPFPEIYIAAGEVNLESGEGKEILVDGQQRITTLYQYFIGSEDLKYENGLIPYTKLEPGQQEAFLEYEVVVRDLGKLDIETIKTVFQRINSTNYSLNAIEIHNSRYDGEIKRLADAISELEFFENHRVFTNNDIKRMRDLGFSLVVIITLLSTYFNLEDEFEEYLQRFNDEFSQKEEIEYQIKYLLDLIDNLNFDEKSRVFKKSDLFTLIVELHRTIFRENKKIDQSKLESELKSFYQAVEDKVQEPIFQDYSKAVLQGTNNRSGRIMRGKIIYSIINSCII